MKKIIIALVMLCLTSIIVNAEQNVGFQDNNANKKTIVEALKMQDDSYVTVEGNITKRISEDKYLFKDSTGTMTVEIDTEKWNGQTVNMNDKLELTGEIEKKFKSTILDVDNVKIITK